MANSSNTISLGAFTGTGAGSSILLPNTLTDGACVVITGTFDATVIVEISIDDTNYVAALDNTGAAISFTAPAMAIIPVDVSAIRGNCTVFSSGTATLKLLPRVG